MAKVRPLPVPKKESSFGKFIVILIVAGVAAGGYFKRDEVAQKFHDIMHSHPIQEDEPASAVRGTLADPAAAALPAPAAAPAVAAAPVSSTSNPCAAFAAGTSQYSMCADREQKLQRMKDQESLRNKIYLPPAPPVPPGAASDQPPASTTAAH